MTLNENSQVEEAANEPVLIPETEFNLVPIDQLGHYLHKKELIGIKLLVYLCIFTELQFELFTLLTLYVPSLTIFPPPIINCRCYWFRITCIIIYEHPKEI